MKFLNRIATASATLLLSLTMAGLSFGSHAAAADCYQYNQNGFPTSSTPVFNNICGIPNIGNESDFVRVRQNNAGNDESDLKLNDFNGGTLTAACSDGDKFDVINYVHNNAVPGDNPDQNPSNPTAVANDVKEALTATFGTSDKFTFGDTVTASNAASVTDTASLDCNGKQVQLSLVPKTVHVFSQAYGANDAGAWVDLPDSIINGGATPIGSTNAGASSATSGTQWGCWTYVTFVVYEVTVQTPPAPQVTATCDMFNVLANSDRTVTVNVFNFTAKNVNFSNAVINWGDNNTTKITDTSKLVGQSHQYGNFGTYLITAVVSFSNGATSGGQGTACAQQVQFNNNQPPIVLTSTTPKQLVNTGPGEVVGLFSGATAAGAFGYRKFLSRRLGR